MPRNPYFGTFPYECSFSLSEDLIFISSNFLQSLKKIGEKSYKNKYFGKTPLQKDLGPKSVGITPTQGCYSAALSGFNPILIDLIQQAHKSGSPICIFCSPVWPRMTFCFAVQEFTGGEVCPPTRTLPLGGGRREGRG
jgi:hypothetical protein